MRLTLTLPAIVAVALLLAAAALTGCEKSPPPVTLRIGVYPSSSLLPYYVAQEQGYDKKYGLQFHETVYPGAEGAIEAMLTGALDLSVSISTIPLLAAAERGLIPGKLVPVAANSFADPEHPAIGVLVAHSIRGWKDLEGKKIASNAPNSLSTAAAEIRLEHEGVRSYTFVQMPFSGLGPALAGGNVAAASMVEPYLTESLLRGDGKLLGWIVGGAPFEQSPFAAIVFSAEFRRRNPEGVKAFLRAHLAAARWINDHPDEARLVLAKRLNLSAEVAKKVKLVRWPIDARSDPALLGETQQVLLRAGRIKRPVDTRALYDETLLTEVLKEKR
jgi:NitT/TauT family transport system substrate-binding protein